MRSNKMLLLKTTQSLILVSPTSIIYFFLHNHITSSVDRAKAKVTEKSDPKAIQANSLAQPTPIKLGATKK
jgi:hypothetical protein